MALAAGRSRRFAGGNKLLAEIGGTPLVCRVAAALVASRATPIIVVTGHESAAIEGALDGLDVRCVKNENFAEGLATSLACGLAALPATAQGAMVCLADMPDLAAAHADRLIAAFDEAAAERIVYARRADGGQGNPVVWPRRFFPDLQALSGDTGGKALIAAHADEAVGVTLDADLHGLPEDIDTEHDLAAWRTKTE